MAVIFCISPLTGWNRYTTHSFKPVKSRVELIHSKNSPPNRPPLANLASLRNVASLALARQSCQIHLGTRRGTQADHAARQTDDAAALHQSCYSRRDQVAQCHNLRRRRETRHRHHSPWVVFIFCDMFHWNFCSTCFGRLEHVDTGICLFYFLKNKIYIQPNLVDEQKWTPCLVKSAAATPVLLSLLAWLRNCTSDHLAWWNLFPVHCLNWCKCHCALIVMNKGIVVYFFHWTVFCCKKVLIEHKKSSDRACGQNKFTFFNRAKRLKQLRDLLLGTRLAPAHRVHVFHLFVWRDETQRNCFEVKNFKTFFRKTFLRDFHLFRIVRLCWVWTRARATRCDRVCLGA